MVCIELENKYSLAVAVVVLATSMILVIYSPVVLEEMAALTIAVEASMALMMLVRGNCGAAISVPSFLYVETINLTNMHQGRGNDSDNILLGEISIKDWNHTVSTSFLEN